MLEEPCNGTYKRDRNLGISRIRKYVAAEEIAEAVGQELLDFRQVLVLIYIRSKTGQEAVALWLFVHFIQNIGYGQVIFLQ